MYRPLSLCSPVYCHKNDDESTCRNEGVANHRIESGQICLKLNFKKFHFHLTHLKFTFATLVIDA